MHREVTRAIELLDRPDASGAIVSDELEDETVDVSVTTVEGAHRSTDFVTVEIPGTDPDAPTIGVVGRLGGIGVRPSEIGIVSDADGAVVALASAIALTNMADRGDSLPGDVVIATHVCPNAPTVDRDPVPFVTNPVTTATMNEHEVTDRMDAVLSVDATKGNRVHCRRGFAVTPPVKQGWILGVSEDLLDVQERVTGEPPNTLAITMADITPYGNDVDHINTILQPATATTAPVVGVGTTSVNPVAGTATGANYIPELAAASRFAVEVSKDFTRDRLSFYDPAEFDRLTERYGPMDQLVSPAE
jgi:hypothetical protein